MNPKQIAKSSKALLKHFRANHERVSDERKSARRTDFMRASHRAYLRRKTPPLAQPDSQK